MSTVTDVILIVGCLTDEAQAKQFSEALKLAGQTEAELVKVDDYAGGNKALQADVYIGAYNYLDNDEALDAFYAIEWESRDQVQLMMKYESWDRFNVFVPEIHRTMFPEEPQSPQGCGEAASAEPSEESSSLPPEERNP